MKYIVITGGVVSGLGKGITISSIGRVLKASGLKVTSIKIDPYLNVDAGTMSPFEHGETFVLDDGGETDLDLGNYERFLDITLTAKHNITSGKIYKEVIRKERQGDYLGKTVQMVPHATDLVQSWIKEVAAISVDGTGASPDVCLIEVGGTVGDIESMIFLEALRQFQFSVGRENILFVHVSLVPVLGTVGEQKTKPTQHSVKELRALGLSADLIVCRSSELLSESTKQKISLFCHVDASHIISVHDVSNIYHVPLILVKQDIHTILKKRLGLDDMFPTPDLIKWETLAHSLDRLQENKDVQGSIQQVSIAIVGKYNGLSDSYLSVTKALTHSAIHLQVDVCVQWVDAAELEPAMRDSDVARYEAAWTTLRAAKGVLIPGGFGVRGVLGKIRAAQYARTHKVPLLGVCLGLQAMVIEYARNVLALSDAHSTEFDTAEQATPHPAVVFMPEGDPSQMGGTMRLGARPTHISTHVTTSRGRQTSLAADVYGISNISGDSVDSSIDNTARNIVSERHRHRYEVNPAMVEQLEAAGLMFTGRDALGVRMEIAELPRDVHPFFFGTQYHPEFKSRPNRPSPPFFAFVAAAAGLWAELSAAGGLWQEHAHSKSQCSHTTTLSARTTTEDTVTSDDVTQHLVTATPRREWSAKSPGLLSASPAPTTPRQQLEAAPHLVLLPRPPLKHLSQSPPLSSRSGEEDHGSYSHSRKSSIVRSISVHCEATQPAVTEIGAQDEAGIDNDESPLKLPRKG